MSQLHASRICFFKIADLLPGLITHDCCKGAPGSVSTAGLPVLLMPTLSLPLFSRPVLLLPGFWLPELKSPTLPLPTLPFPELVLPTLRSPLFWLPTLDWPAPPTRLQTGAHVAPQQGKCHVWTPAYYIVLLRCRLHSKGRAGFVHRAEEKADKLTSVTAPPIASCAVGARISFSVNPAAMQEKVVPGQRPRAWDCTCTWGIVCQARSWGSTLCKTSFLVQ